MPLRALILLLTVCLVLGCSIMKPKSKLGRQARLRKAAVQEVKNYEAPFQQHMATNFDWSSIRRVVLMPLANQTAYTRVHEEMQSDLGAELQRAGHFDIVVATREDEAVRALDVFVSGRFNEIDLLRIAREYQADAVIFANVTQYHPYAMARVGVSLLMISPAEGVVVGSLNGMWDLREKSTAEQAELDFAQHQDVPRSLRGPERVVESPEVFRRFVCRQIAVALVPPTVQPGTNPTPIGAGAMPPNTTMPIEGTMPAGMAPPPVPPAVSEIR